MPLIGGVTPSEDERRLAQQHSMQLESVRLTSGDKKAGGSAALRTTLIAVAVAVITSTVVGILVAFAMKKPDACVSHASTDPYDISAGSAVAPSVLSPLFTASSARIPRADASFKNTKRENKTVSAGVSTIKDEAGTTQYDVRLEVATDMPFGEYATKYTVGRRSLRIVITNASSGERTAIIPFGLHTVPMLNHSITTLIPNLFFLQHIPSGGRDAPGAFKTFLSTVSGRTVASDPALQRSVAKVLNPFLRSYWRAALAEEEEAASSASSASSSSSTSRRLYGYSYGGSSSEGSDTYEGSELGGEAGSYVGGKVGGKIGGAVGGDVGEAVGGAVGGAIGSLVGPEGTAVGADIGSAIGRELGSYTGKKVGSDLGSDLGSDVGSDVGGDLGSAVSSWSYGG